MGIQITSTEIPIATAGEKNLPFGDAVYDLIRPAFERDFTRGRYKIRVRPPFIRPFTWLKGKKTGKIIEDTTSRGTFIYKGVI